MSKIVKNNTASPVFIADVGLTVPASGQHTIAPTDYWLWAASSDLIVLVGDGTLTVNDGSVDLSISDGIDLIKGIFQKTRIIGGTDSTIIGNVGDRMKVDASVTTTNTYFPALDTEKIFSTTALINAASSSAFNPIALIKNPVGSGKKIYTLRASGNSTISNERTLFGFHWNPTITNDGTTNPVLNRKLNSSPLSSVILAYTLPTISNRGDDVSWAQTGENTNEQEIIGVELCLIMPGQNVLFTAKPKSNNRVQTFSMVWYEVDL